MKAVIMAGGKGTRLRPLTCNIPKPMVPILNIPVMEYIIRLLKKMDIVEIAVTAFYLPETIKDYFGDGEKWGVSLKYFLEESPLGTAGSVHNADDFLDETFLVISGDAMSDFNVQKAVDFHMENGADATIILSQENIPLDYGVIMVDEKKKIIRFLEKPAWSQVFSDTINTGIYILEPEIFNIFPKNKKYDFSKDLFPLMLKNNRDLYGLPLNGYWNDIGSLEEYRQTNFDLIEGLINLDINKDYSKIDENIYIENNVNIDDSAILKGPLYISEGSEIAQGVYLESSVIGRNARILSYSSVKKSVLWNNIYLDSRTEIRGATIADNVIIKDGVEIYEKSIIGRKVKVGRKSVIKPGVKIWPEKLIEDESDVNDSLIWSSGWKRKLFTNLGIVGISNVDITPEYLARLASAYAAVLKPGDELIISSDTYEISKSLSRAFISGLQSSGVNVLDIGNSITPVVRYSIMKFSAAGGVFIHVSQKNNTRIVRRKKARFT